MPNFQTFTKRLVPLTKQPFVTVQKRGIMSFNRSAFAAMGEPDAVELLFDPDEQIIGIRGVDPTVEHAYGIRSQANDTTFVVSGTAFARYYKLDTTISRRYLAVMDDGVLCLDLKTGGTVVRGTRSEPTDFENDAAEAAPQAFPPQPDPLGRPLTNGNGVGNVPRLDDQGVPRELI